MGTKERKIDGKKEVNLGKRYWKEKIKKEWTKKKKERTHERKRK